MKEWGSGWRPRFPLSGIGTRQSAIANPFLIPYSVLSTRCHQSYAAVPPLPAAKPTTMPITMVSSMMQKTASTRIPTARQ